MSQEDWWLHLEAAAGLRLLEAIYISDPNSPMANLFAEQKTRASLTSIVPMIDSAHIQRFLTLMDLNVDQLKPLLSMEVFLEDVRNKLKQVSDHSNDHNLLDFSTATPTSSPTVSAPVTPPKSDSHVRPVFDPVQGVSSSIPATQPQQQLLSRVHASPGSESESGMEHVDASQSKKQLLTQFPTSRDLNKSDLVPITISDDVIFVRTMSYIAIERPSPQLCAQLDQSLACLQGLAESCRNISSRAGLQEMVPVLLSTAQQLPFDINSSFSTTDIPSLCLDIPKARSFIANHFRLLDSVVTPAVKAPLITNSLTPQQDSDPDSSDSDSIQQRFNSLQAQPAQTLPTHFGPDRRSRIKKGEDRAKEFLSNDYALVDALPSSVFNAVTIAELLSDLEDDTIRHVFHLKFSAYDFETDAKGRPEFRKEFIKNYVSVFKDRGKGSLFKDAFDDELHNWTKKTDTVPLNNKRVEVLGTLARLTAQANAFKEVAKICSIELDVDFDKVIALRMNQYLNKFLDADKIIKLYAPKGGDRTLYAFDPKKQDVSRPVIRVNDDFILDYRIIIDMLFSNPSSDQSRFRHDPFGKDILSMLRPAYYSLKGIESFTNTDVDFGNVAKPRDTLPIFVRHQQFFSEVFNDRFMTWRHQGARAPSVELILGPEPINLCSFSQVFRRIDKLNPKASSAVNPSATNTALTSPAPPAPANASTSAPSDNSQEASGQKSYDSRRAFRRKHRGGNQTHVLDPNKHAQAIQQQESQKPLQQTTQPVSARPVVHPQRLQPQERLKATASVPHDYLSVKPDTQSQPGADRK